MEHLFYFGPDADGGGGSSSAPAGGEGAEGGAGETSSEPSSQPSPGQGQRGAAPWDAELAKLGLTDPRYSDYLRTNIQPRMTQYEQQVAAQNALYPEGLAGQFAGGAAEAAQVAAGIMAGLDTDPIGTIQQLVQLLEINPELLQTLQEAAGEDPSAQAAVDAAAGEAGTEGQGNQAPSEEIAWARQQMEKQQTDAEDSQYQAHVAEVAKRFGAGFDNELYNYAMIINKGDPIAAGKLYESKFHNPQTTAAPPSPTLGQGAGIAPAETPRPTSIKDAMKQYMLEDKASRGR
jgi:hypothetical protein